ncbi:MAG: acetyl-CoA carboxylase carboxyltransferase subunit alpha [Kiritimatiellia bacterium]|nr:acetyl-CoA carboxylase carboxyltransferase subunit alpha [Lentisphaerota bacterium]
MATYQILPFEKSIAEMEEKLLELRAFGEAHDLDLARELEEMQRKIEETRRQVFQNLKAWDIVQLARHPQRPYALDYISRMCTDFVELHGDRHYADDRAVAGGFARLDGRKVMVIGLHKGRDVKSNVERNFGMAYPEGYRKALRLMRLAARYNCPIISLIDTAGAYPGVGGEERHVAEAIAFNLREAFTLPVPMIVTVIGEGGSGGALGIGIGDRILIMEYSYYSVISPEGCAAILWKDRAHAGEAAELLHLTSRALLQDGLVDEIVPEPPGGAHRDWDAAAANLKQRLLHNLDELRKYSADRLLEQRYAKFRAMGVCLESSAPDAPLAEAAEPIQPESDKE